MPTYQLIGSATPNSVARAIANEVVSGKNAIAAAINTKTSDNNVESTDTFQDMAEKILSITGEVNVEPIQGTPPNWHDLAQVVASNQLEGFPYSFALLLTKNMTSIMLTGADRFITSDGVIHSGNGVYNFDTTKDFVGGDQNAVFSGILAGMATAVTITADVPGSVGNIKLIGNGTSLNALISAWNIANPSNTLTLNGDGTQIPTAKFNGLVNGMITPVNITENAGGDFGNITLTANGTTVAALISVWNTANPTKQITLNSGIDTQVPTSDIVLRTENIQLLNGVIGNIGKDTRWVVFLNSTRDIMYNFATTNPLINDYLLMVYINNVNPKNLIFTGVTVPKILFGKVDLNAPFDFGSNSFDHIYGFTDLSLPEGLTEINITGNYVFWYTYNLVSFAFPKSAKKIIINGNSLFQYSNIKTIHIPAGIEDISFISYSTFQYAKLASFLFPIGLKNLNLGGLNQFKGSKLSYVKISNPTISFNWDNSGMFDECTLLTNIELENEWNRTISLASATYITAPNIVANIFNKLADKRKDGVSASTVTTATTSPVVTAVNGNFTKVFRVGETITIAAVAVRTILSIENDNQLTLTANAATTGSGQTYNINKTLTLGTTNLNKLSAPEKLIATDKGWTLA